MPIRIRSIEPHSQERGSFGLWGVGGLRRGARPRVQAAREHTGWWPSAAPARSAVSAEHVRSRGQPGGRVRGDGEEEEDRWRMGKSKTN